MKTSNQGPAGGDDGAVRGSEHQNNLSDSPSSKGEFDRLKKLLIVKRYEQPPPGYFNRLPNQIMSRIEAGEGQARFWEKLIPSFTLRPAMAYGFGLAVCGVVAFGVYYTSNVPVNNAGTANAGSMTASQPTGVTPVNATEPSAIAARNPAMVNSTNPITEPSLFPEQVGQGLRTAPAGYTPH
jgi:hypothetical protein